jgi:hypothetical protein
MKPSEIILNSVHSQDPKMVLAKIDAALRTGNAILLQENNSVLFLLRFAKGKVALHLYTQDTPLTLAKSISRFIQKIRNSDIKEVYGKAENPQILRFLETLGVDVMTSDNPKFNWMAKV